mmetsp:Transcript_45805/g.97909  ORF Transcript_45805/g.97909 Transcript_45805/m.97909 type:complete len:720 (-) Transcript_45805:74-2233(-)|eukprot:CAMPEP_0204318950 /NCGR_PEP_ID=MMETSP0469-20131031/6820_1 /ASSEMBLY_ACC=CAM_ASM_000384 /TAXON_ID=2969 /ORGANISM="Oxyrrhis marina" /LENGTH=719 /DNA_ID=CAMNT_0051300063 /DNA_START=20 /DNA_END=2179 /DNA_ORIENTATION=+
METQLTPDGCKLLMANPVPGMPLPVLQVADHKVLDAKDARARVLFSDGVHILTVLYALSGLQADQHLRNGDIVQVQTWACTADFKMTVLHYFTKVVSEAAPIGDPRIKLRSAGATQATPGDSQAQGAAPVNPFAAQAANLGSAPSNPFVSPAAAAAASPHNPFASPVAAAPPVNPFAGQSAASPAPHNPFASSAMSNGSLSNNPFPPTNPSSGQFGATTAPTAGGPTPRGLPLSHGASRAAPYAGRPVARNDGDLITPIHALNLYVGKWKIKGRLSWKSDRRTFRNARGEGQMFSADVTDKDNGVVRVVFFGDSVDKFFPNLHQGKVYTFARGQVKVANKKFAPNADHEITFDGNAQIEEADDDASIAQQSYKFVPISEVENKDVNALVDIAAVVRDMGEESMITIRSSGLEKKKRSLVLLDESNTTIELTLWGDKCNLLNNVAPNPVIFVKDARVSEFNGGKTLGTGWSTQLEFNPDHEKSFGLKAWYQTVGVSTSTKQLSMAPGGARMRNSVLDLHEENKYIGLQGENGQVRDSNYHVIRAIILHIPHERPPYYMSCPQDVPKSAAQQRADDRSPQAQQQTRKCMKKVENLGGMWSCAEGHQSPDPVPRYLLNLTLHDHSGQVYVTAFDEVGAKILGMDAGQLHEKYLNKDNDEEGYDRVFSEATFQQAVFKLRSKKDSRYEEEKVKVVVQDMYAMNHADECKAMLKGLEDAGIRCS